MVVNTVIDVSQSFAPQLAESMLKKNEIAGTVNSQPIVFVLDTGAEVGLVPEKFVPDDPCIGKAVFVHSASGHRTVRITARVEGGHIFTTVASTYSGMELWKAALLTIDICNFIYVELFNDLSAQIRSRVRKMSSL